MNRRFPILSAVSLVLRVLGWLIVLCALGGSIIGVYELAVGANFLLFDFLRQPSWVAWDALIALSAIVGAFGLSLAISGEIIGVLFAIEMNTRSTLPFEARR
jgi:hypothetical protein